MCQLAKCLLAKRFLAKRRVESCQWSTFFILSKQLTKIWRLPSLNFLFHLLPQVDWPDFGALPLYQPIILPTKYFVNNITAIWLNTNFKILVQDCNLYHQTSKNTSDSSQSVTCLYLIGNATSNGVTTLSIMTFSIKGLLVTLRINVTRQK